MPEVTLQQAFDLASQHRQAGRLNEAEGLCRQILTVDSRHPDALELLGAIACQTGRHEDGESLLRQAIAFRPMHAASYGQLGIVLWKLDRLDEAEAAHRQAIALAPSQAEAHFCLGRVLREQGRFDEALVSYRRAIKLRPHFAEAHGDSSLVHLLLGRFHEGWHEYEWRWHCDDFTSRPRGFPQPQWEGGPLQGRTILLHTEQGFGDAIQFVRYVPLVLRRGGRVIIECEKELLGLFHSMDRDIPVLTKGEPLPAFDVHCPFLSLPRLFATDEKNIPCHIPYLTAAPKTVAGWRSRLEKYSPHLKVGLAWAGRPTHTNDRNRSIKLANLDPLAKVHGVRLFSLQKGPGTTESKSSPGGFNPIDFSKQLKDFSDTAALIANLDLVITVDTAVAHLAGAMAKPVWVLLPSVPDWRWMLNRSDSPWYPGMKLFRQTQPREWSPVVDEVRKQLVALVRT
ncbi:MAG: tetratricopeptide repeat protein [Verrucomicrobiales bacterium]